MSISFSGLASGLDTSSWVTSLTALKNAKVTTLEAEKETLLSCQDSLANIKNYFSSFRLMVEKVTDAKYGIASMNIFSQKLATSANVNIATASATTEAKEATYTLSVDNLATNTEAVSGFKFTTTYVETTMAKTDSLLENIGVTAGSIGVTDSSGTEREVKLYSTDTIGSFITKLQNLGINAYYNETTGIFSMNASASAIRDYGNTNIINALHITGVNEGYETDENFKLQTEETEETVVVATEDTALSILGVSAGTIRIVANDYEYDVEIEDGDNIGELLKALKDEGIDATFEDGIFSIKDAYIKDDGTTGLIEAFGFDDTEVARQVQSSENLGYNTTVTTTTVVTEETLFKDIGEGIDFEDGDSIIVKNSENELSTITLAQTTTLGNILSEMRDAGLSANLSDEGKLIIYGGTIQGGTFDFISEIGLEEDAYTAMVSGYTLQETSTSTVIATLTTKLVDDLGVKKGYYEVTNSAGETSYLKVSETETIYDLMSGLNSLGIATSFDETTGAITITGGGFKTLTDAEVGSLVTAGTITEESNDYIAGTDLINCLFGSDTVSSGAQRVISTSANSVSLKYNVTSTVNATLSTTFEQLKMSEDTETVTFDVGGDSRSIEVTKTMSINGFISALDGIGIHATFDEATSKITIDNATLVQAEGTADANSVAGILGLDTIVSGQYVSSDKMYTQITVNVNMTGSSMYTTSYVTATLDTTLGSLNITDRSLNIYNSVNVLLTEADYAMNEDDTIRTFFNTLGSYGISGTLAGGVITLTSASGAYITGGLADALGIGTASTVYTEGTEQISGIALQYTKMVDATGETTLEQAGVLYSAESEITIYNKYDDAIGTVTVNPTTTFNQMFSMLVEHSVGGTIADGLVTLNSDIGNYAAGVVIDNLGLTRSSSTQNVTYNSTQTSQAAVTYLVTMTASGMQSLGQVGALSIGGSETLTILDKYNSVIGSFTITDETLLGDYNSGITDSSTLAGKLLDYQITLSVDETTGILTMESLQGNYISINTSDSTMSALENLGIGVVDTENGNMVTFGITQTSTVQVTYAVTLEATGGETLERLGLLSSGESSVIKVKNKYGGNYSSFTVNSSSTLNDIKDGMSTAGITATIESGKLHITSATDGRYLEGDLIDALEMKLETSGHVTTGVEMTSTDYLTYTVLATNATKLCDIVGIGTDMTISIKDRYGSVVATTTFSETTTAAIEGNDTISTYSGFNGSNTFTVQTRDGTTTLSAATNTFNDLAAAMGGTFSNGSITTSTENYLISVTNEYGNPPVHCGNGITYSINPGNTTTGIEATYVYTKDTAIPSTTATIDDLVNWIESNQMTADYDTVTGQLTVGSTEGNYIAETDFATALGLSNCGSSGTVTCGIVLTSSEPLTRESISVTGTAATSAAYGYTDTYGIAQTGNRLTYTTVTGGDATTTGIEQTGDVITSITVTTAETSTTTGIAQTGDVITTVYPGYLACSYSHIVQATFSNPWGNHQLFDNVMGWYLDHEVFVTVTIGTSDGYTHNYTLSSHQTFEDIAEQLGDMDALTVTSPYAENYFVISQTENSTSYIKSVSGDSTMIEAIFGESSNIGLAHTYYQTDEATTVTAASSDTIETFFGEGSVEFTTADDTTHTINASDTTFCSLASMLGGTFTDGRLSLSASTTAGQILKTDNDSFFDMLGIVVGEGESYSVLSSSTYTTTGIAKSFGRYECESIIATTTVTTTRTTVSAAREQYINMGSNPSLNVTWANKFSVSGSVVVQYMSSGTLCSVTIKSTDTISALATQLSGAGVSVTIKAASTSSNHSLKISTTSGNSNYLYSAHGNVGFCNLLFDDGTGMSHNWDEADVRLVGWSQSKTVTQTVQTTATVTVAASATRVNIFAYMGCASLYVETSTGTVTIQTSTTNFSQLAEATGMTYSDGYLTTPSGNNYIISVTNERGESVLNCGEGETYELVQSGTTATITATAASTISDFFGAGSVVYTTADNETHTINKETTKFCDLATMLGGTFTDGKISLPASSTAGQIIKTDNSSFFAQLGIEVGEGLSYQIEAGSGGSSTVNAEENMSMSLLVGWSDDYEGDIILSDGSSLHVDGTTTVSQIKAILSGYDTSTGKLYITGYSDTTDPGRGTVNPYKYITYIDPALGSFLGLSDAENISYFDVSRKSIESETIGLAGETSIKFTIYQQDTEGYDTQTYVTTLAYTSANTFQNIIDGLGSYNISATLSDGVLTFGTGGNNRYFINGSESDSGKISTGTLASFTTTPVVVTESTKLIGLGLDADTDYTITGMKGSYNNYTEFTITVTGSSTVGNLLTGLRNNGFSNSTITEGGTLSIIPDNSGNYNYITSINSDLATALKITGATYTENTQTHGSDSAIIYANTTLVSGTTLGVLGVQNNQTIKGYYQNAGRAKAFTVTVNSTDTTDSLNTKLSSYNISATVDNGFITITPENSGENTYITSISSNLSEKLKLDGVKKYNETGGRINSDSDVQYWQDVWMIDDSTDWDSAEAAAATNVSGMTDTYTKWNAKLGSIGMTQTSEITINIDNTVGQVHTSSVTVLTFTTENTISDVINGLATYGITTRITTSGDAVGESKFSITDYDEGRFILGTTGDLFEKLYLNSDEESLYDDERQHTNSSSDQLYWVDTWKLGTNTSHTDTENSVTAENTYADKTTLYAQETVNGKTVNRVITNTGTCCTANLYELGFRGGSDGKAYIEINLDNTYSNQYVTVTVTAGTSATDPNGTSIDELIAALETYGIHATVNNTDGKLYITEAEHGSFVHGIYSKNSDDELESDVELFNIFKFTATPLDEDDSLGDYLYYHDQGVHHSTSRSLSCNVTMTLDDTATLSDMNVTSGDVLVHTADGYITITVDNSETLGDFFEDLEKAGFEIILDNGVLTLKGDGDTYLNEINESNIVEVLSLQGLTKREGTFTRNTRSDNLGYSTDIVAKTEQSLSDLKDSDGNGISFTNGTANIILQTTNEDGEILYKTLTFAQTDSFEDVIAGLKKVGIDANVDSTGRFIMSSDVYDDINVFGSLGNFIMKDAAKSYITEVETVSYQTKLENITDKDGNSLDISSGNIYVYQNGTRNTLAINNQDTLETLKSKLSGYGITMKIAGNGEISFAGEGDTYLSTEGIADADKSNILEKLNIDDNWSATKTSTARITFEDVNANYIDGSVKLVELRDADGNLLNVTEGTYDVYTNGVKTTKTVTNETTVNDFLVILKAAGMNANISSTGEINVSADSNSYVANSNPYGSNIVDKLFSNGWNFTKVSETNDLSYETTAAVSITRSTKLSAINNEPLYQDGYITVIKNGVQTNVSLTADETVGSLIDTLELYGFEANISVDGKLILNNSGESMLKHYSGEGQASNALEILGIQYDRWITTNSYESDEIDVVKTNEVYKAASKDTTLSDLGITTGEYYIYENGVRHVAMVSSDETVGSLIDTLATYGISANLVQYGQNTTDDTSDDYSVLRIVGQGESYICKSNSQTNASNIDELFDGVDCIYNYTASLSTNETITHTLLATENTLLSYYDTSWGDTTLKSEGTLAVTVDGMTNNIIITADETIGSLLDKFRAVGVEASYADGKIVLQSGFKDFSINSEGTTSNLLAMLNLSYKTDLGGYAASSDSCIASETITEELTTSVANKADYKTKLSCLNISDGTLSLYRNGQRAVIDINSDDTFEQLKEKVNAKFSDINMYFDNGYLTFEAADENTIVDIGSNGDTSNFISICGMSSGQNSSKIASSRELYKVNGQTVLTEEGMFTKGKVNAGTFIIGDAEFEITETTTLDDIIAQINSSDKTNATAYWSSVEGKFIIKSRETGASMINVEAGTSNFTDIMGYTTTDRAENGTVLISRINKDMQNIGQNASFALNGVTYTSSSNNVGSDVTQLEGLTINLKSASEGETTEIVVEKDSQNVSSSVANIIEAYNEFLTNIDNEISTTTSDSNASTLKLLRNRIRSTMTGSVKNENSVFKTLSSIGIALDKASPNNISTTNLTHLNFDENKFLEAFNADADSIQTLLVGTEDSKGLFRSIEDILEEALESSYGYFTTTEKSYSQQLKNLNSQIAKATQAADTYKSRLENKFNTLDITISNIKKQYSTFLSTSSYLS